MTAVASPSRLASVLAEIGAVSREIDRLERDLREYRGAGFRHAEQEASDAIEALLARIQALWDEMDTVRGPER
jgi:hypothetical protein